jgi:putative membrane protein
MPLHYAQGLLMGGADIIPGVSGGTMALIVGIYERLIDAIHAVAHGAVAVARGERRDGLATLRGVPWGFVLPLGFGILTALGIGTVVIEPLLEAYPVAMAALFAGLIIGALPIPWKRIRARSSRVYAAAAAAGVVAFLLAGLTESGVGDPSLLMVFAAAAVAICAMILPGISGAYLLLVMGMYRPTLSAARALDVAYLATFAAGAIIGLGAFSKVLAWLLDHRHDLTMAALVGLMAGSLRRLWPWQTEVGALVAPGDGSEIGLAVALVVLGATAVLALERLGARATPEEVTTGESTADHD